MIQHKLMTAALTLPLIFATAKPANDDGNKKRNRISFDMVSANACVSQATARIKVVSTGTAEDMTIHVSGLPANTNFRLLCDPGAQGPLWALLVSRGCPDGRGWRSCPAF